MGTLVKYQIEDWPEEDRQRWDAATLAGTSVVYDGKWARMADETKRQAFIMYSR